MLQSSIGLNVQAAHIAKTIKQKKSYEEPTKHKVIRQLKLKHPKRIIF